MNSGMNQKRHALEEIYEAFAARTEGFRSGSACAKGCAFCCTEAGKIDITTLEGLRIQEAIHRMERTRRNRIQKALSREMVQRESGRVVPCPFLQKNNSCMIYEIRPFACRRIYSVHRCSMKNPPMLSRHAMDLARETLTGLQRLDEHGYSGHISYILHMLDVPRFFETYVAEAFKPEEILAFGKTHGIMIHKRVTGIGGGAPVDK